MIREFLKDEVEVLAGLQVRALITMLDAALNGADADGALLQASAPFAAGTLRVGEEPFQALAELRKREAFLLREAVGPPLDPESVNIPFHPGHGLQQVLASQLAIIA
jgi:hypothetical protein